MGLYIFIGIINLLAGSNAILVALSVDGRLETSLLLILGLLNLYVAGGSFGMAWEMRHRIEGE